MIDGSYEVLVLVDEACNLMVHDEAVSGLTGLDIVACRAMAVALAVGSEPVQVNVESTVGECIGRAARLSAAWDPAQLTAEALQLVLLLSDVNYELNKA